MPEPTPSVAPVPGSRAGSDDTDAPLRTPPSWGKLVLVILTSLLLIPLGIGTGRKMMGGCDGARSATAVAWGEELDAPLLRYQLLRERGPQGARRLSDEEHAAGLRRALERSLAVYALAEHGASQGLEVDDRELGAYLTDERRNADLPMLRGPNGRFELKHYARALRIRFQLGTVRYEDYKRRELLARKALATLPAEALGAVVAPRLHATEAWLFHPALAAQLGGQVSGPGPAVQALVEAGTKSGEVVLPRPPPSPAAGQVPGPPARPERR